MAEGNAGGESSLCMSACRTSNMALCRYRDCLYP